MTDSIHHSSTIRDQLSRAIDMFGTFLIVGAATLALMLNAVFTEQLSNARLGVVLGFLLLVHMLRYPRFVLNRECLAYTLLVAYMVIQLLWTRDIRLAMNTLTPAFTFILILCLFGSLVTYHNSRAVLVGLLAGVFTGAGIYTLATSFPIVRPLEFSYNAIAGMYLFGLFVSLLLVCYKCWTRVALLVGLIFLLLIVATTSIKTNLGVLLGAVAASIIYFKQLSGVIRKNAVALVTLGCLLGVFVSSNDTFIQTIQLGYDRVMLGVEILEARENLPGYSGLDNRSQWVRDGLIGWTHNPIFGHGVEAFRSRYGTTSHSTAVDLLYNSGLVGFLLYYYIFLSVMWRLAAARNDRARRFSALILGMTVCYLFITMSGIIHYNTFLAAFIAISVSLLGKYRSANSPLRAALAVEQ